MADPYDYDLGEYRRTTSTSSPEALTWFGRGLLWSYAFNHEEAAACFERATAVDPECAMAHWGLAYALGPNYNKPWEFFDEDDLRTTVEQAHDAVEQALALVGRAEPVEQALIRALEARYPSRVAVEDCSIWNAGYAEAMQGVYAQFSDDLDVATLYADALMNLTPWQLWDIRTGEPAPGSRAVEAREVLDRALELPGGAQHAGLLHMYVHLMEMSSEPEQALRVADRLRGLVPDGGHLQHMPSHLDVLCGNYKAAMDANSAAVAADERFLARSGPMNFYTLYRAHNLHFLIYAAMFLGQSQVALDTVKRLESSMPEELLRVESPPMADWLEGFLAMRVHALIRFGRWDDLLALELPSDPQLYCVTTAMTHYAHGVAFAATGRISEAEEERAMFREAVKKVVPTRTLFNNTCLDILGVAAAMLDGELAYRKGDFDEAFEHLRRSIELDDQLPYDEPWGWMQPTRHAYGALLLEQGRVEEAATVYAADLGLDETLPRPQQHPNNVWSLHGYHECLVRLGRTAEAGIIGRQLTLAEAMADVPIEASCFCRLEAFEHANPSAAGGSSCRTGARHDHEH
jgi:tetratricopeptide (TPR) repeat protein